ncbi:hypothetical protein HanPSC8_Chr15g0653131 [Helianthus annuus]|nr:hypothetical protein HanPSC8_Chr15g0653131 [Helianthus annuus]
MLIFRVTCGRQMILRTICRILRPDLLSWVYIPMHVLSFWSSEFCHFTHQEIEA